MSQLQETVAFQSGVYRAAFPAFRVFIYGQEVSGDTISVRVNQSGGSMDRSPGTCSITLYNPNDKYIMDHSDMVALSNSRGDLINYLSRSVTANKALLDKVSDSSGEKAIEADEFLSLMSSAGRFEELSAQIAEFYQELEQGSVWHQKYWEEGSVPDAIKLNVIEKKAPRTTGYSSEARQTLRNEYSTGTYSEQDFEYYYPFTEGDCIFHPNDPIRIAFRDPFEPSTWYWMFSGFVDGFTEDMGVNQESTLTIVGTDVSKVLRYSYLQLNVDATLDPGLSEIFPGDPMFAGAGAEVNWIAYSEIFAHFTVVEILEMLFFGAEKFLGALTEMTQRTVEKMGLNDRELDVYLAKSGTNLTSDAIAKMSLAEKKDTLREYFIGTKKSRFEGGHFPPVHGPDGVTFNRRTDKVGVYTYFIESKKNKADQFDKAIGKAIASSNLRSLNEVLHHRVRIEDLSLMETTTRGLEDLQAEYNLMGGDVRGSDPAMGLSDIVTTIGMDIERYPVGAGRVFYVAPATFSLGVSSGVMNEMMGASNGGLHTEFKDRLTYLYDVAEQIQFCCYATPRGDFVFEMPFYDYDPWHFSKEDSHLANKDIERTAESLGTAYEMMRLNIGKWAAGSENYEEVDIYEMMRLSSDLQLVREGIDIDTFVGDPDFNYSTYFTINKHETLGFSNSVNDNGLKTFSRSAPHNIARWGVEVNDINTRNYQWAIAPGLASLLGPRPVPDKDPWTEVTTEAAAKFYAAIELRKANAEARNIGLQVLPHFGLMVNRPLYWRQRNYIGNIVSCQHSIAVNSSCDTSVNLNLVRGWTGLYQEGSNVEMFRHFGGDTPFSYASLLDENKTSGQEKGESKALKTLMDQRDPRY